MKAVRRDGVVVARKVRPWHKTWHFDQQGDFGFQSLSFEALGVLKLLENMAGCTSDYDGSIRLNGGPKLTRRNLLELIARKQFREPVLTNAAKKWGKEIVDALVATGQIVIGTSDTVFVANWLTRQEEQVTPAGERKREQRARARGPVGRPPSGPPPWTGTDDFDDDLDRNADTDAGLDLGQSQDSHNRSPDPESRTEKRDTYPPINDVHRRLDAPEDVRLDAAARSGGGPEGGRPTGGDDQSGVDIYALDPVDAACRLMREHGARAANLARKAVREVGPEAVRTALGELRDAWRDNVVRAVNRDTGRPTGRPLFVRIIERNAGRQIFGQSSFQPQARQPIGFQP